MTFENISQKEQKPMFRPIFNVDLIKQSEYDIEVVNWLDSAQRPEINKMIVSPVERGNILTLKESKGDAVNLRIPLSKIDDVRIVEGTKGSFLKRNDLLLDLLFHDAQGSHAIRLNADDKKIQEILSIIQENQNIESSYTYYADLTELPSLEGVGTVHLYHNLPYLNESEELIWSYIKTDDIINKQIRWLEALTNYRAFTYDFATHRCTSVTHDQVEDVIVTNSRRESNSNYYGTISGKYARTSVGQSKTTSRTIGDVVFIKAGQPFLKFAQITDPSSIVKLAKASRKSILTLLKSISYFDQIRKNNNKKL